MNWSIFIENEKEQSYFKKIEHELEEIKKHNLIYPPDNEILNAFNLTTFDDTKVVIIGQDPYHGYNQAHGLSFSIKENNKLPPSLKNIYKELKDDLNIERISGDLTDWANQGVLLLNNILTVSENNANSHKNIGWNLFTDNVIKLLNEKKTGLVFILWGKTAQNKANIIDSNKHLVLKSTHPSPLSANRGGFFGTKPFSRCNDFLGKKNKINW